MSYLGIDPGQKGGIAVIGPNGAEAWRYPGDLSVAADLLRAIVLEHQPRLAAVEKVTAMAPQRPGASMGTKSAFTFGGNFYGWQWALSVLQVPYVLVTPHQWQKVSLDAGTGETKERSLSMARRLFPEVDLKFKADDGKADALMLALYAQRWRDAT